jgi:hypothetical protein
VDVGGTAVALSVEISAKGFVDLAILATQNRLSALNTLSTNLAIGEFNAATKLVSTVSLLENANLSQADITDTASEVVWISNLANSLLSIANGVESVAKLQNTITVYSWIGRPIAGPALKQLYEIVTTLNDARDLGNQILQAIK